MDVEEAHDFAIVDPEVVRQDQFFRQVGFVVVAIVETVHDDLAVVIASVTDLHRYVTELPDFAGDPKASNEGKLEAIQMAWHEEFQDRTQA